MKPIDKLTRSDFFPGVIGMEEHFAFVGRNRSRADQDAGLRQFEGLSPAPKRGCVSRENTQNGCGRRRKQEKPRRHAPDRRDGVLLQYSDANMMVSTRTGWQRSARSPAWPLCLLQGAHMGGR
jgi:hypothetical protein